jgi:hypothetical protein
MVAQPANLGRVHDLGTIQVLKRAPRLTGIAALAPSADEAAAVTPWRTLFSARWRAAAPATAIDSCKRMLT